MLLKIGQFSLFWVKTVMYSGWNNSLDNIFTNSLLIIFIAFHVNNNMKVLVIIAIQLFDLQNLQCEFDTFNWLQIRYIHTLIYTNFLCLFFRQVPIQQEDTKSSSGCCCRFIAWVSFAHLKVCMDEQSLSDQTPNRRKPVASAIKHTKKNTKRGVFDSRRH